jgi:hypothetical protein
MSLAALCGLLFLTPAMAQGPKPVGGKSDALGDSEKLKRAADAVNAMRASLRQVSSRVEDARNEKDVVKLNCVNEKLAQIKGLLKVAEQSEAALKDAVASSDPAANAEFAKVGIARNKIDGLGNEAQQCIGQLAYIVDEKTTVEVQQPVGQPERETSGHYRPDPPPSMPCVLRPPCASCFF